MKFDKTNSIVHLKGPGGLKVTLDASEIVPDDPGQGTPAMVYGPFGKGSSTYWCAAAEGELLGPSTSYSLTQQQCEWLNSIEDMVTDWHNHWTQRIQEEGRSALGAHGWAG